MKSVRLTMAQALVRFLAAQKVERDGEQHQFFEGCFGIFGHGNVTGVGQALAESPELLTYYQARNEQAMVHIAAGFARMRNRLATLACTTSIGPGATNLVTGAAAATINRLPVLLLPGDVFASRRPDPVLQQLEVPWRGDCSVNDCLQPVSRYWDRITRPEQLVLAAPAALPVAANRLAADADLVIGVGTRWSDFTTASKTAFRGDGVRFVNVNVADFDAAKHAGLPLVGDARATLEALDERLAGWSVMAARRELA